MIKRCEIDLPIGARFIVDNAQLEVTKAVRCEGCYYCGNLKACQTNNLNCLCFARVDQKSVVFKQVGTIDKNEKP